MYFSLVSFSSDFTIIKFITWVLYQPYSLMVSLFLLQLPPYSSSESSVFLPNFSLLTRPLDLLRLVGDL